MKTLDKKAGRGSALTIAPVAVSCGADPEFCDFEGLRARYGIRRSTAYNLIADGSIRSVVLRRRGTIKGRRLIDLSSVKLFLAELPGDITPQLREHCREANKLAQIKRAENKAKR